MHSACSAHLNVLISIGTVTFVEEYTAVRSRHYLYTAFIKFLS